MARARKPRMAIAYDFDGTLSPGHMQNYNFIPNLGIDARQFWLEVKNNAREHDMDEILSYMELMLEKAREKKLKIDRAQFAAYGRRLKLFPGVEGWFKRINEFAASQDVIVEHHIISSGLREMIAGSPIAQCFKCIFASGFKYDQHDVAVWPAVGLNYTTKTQYLFRINKGIDNSYDNERINRYTPPEDRVVPFSNMVFIGDGETDVPCMKMVAYQGGHAIAVYQRRKPGAKAIAAELVEQGRAGYALAADYGAGSPLDEVVKDIIRRIAINDRLMRAHG